MCVLANVHVLVNASFQQHFSVVVRAVGVHAQLAVCWLLVVFMGGSQALLQVLAATAPLPSTHTCVSVIRGRPCCAGVLAGGCPACLRRCQECVCVTVE
jgi:hypothetical protein